MLVGSDKVDWLWQVMEVDLQECFGDFYVSVKFGGLLISEGKNEDVIFLLENGLKQCGLVGVEWYELLLYLGLVLIFSDFDKVVNCYW